jgi:hypothetical protein
MTQINGVRQSIHPYTTIWQMSEIVVLSMHPYRLATDNQLCENTRHILHGTEG